MDKLGDLLTEAIEHLTMYLEGVEDDEELLLACLGDLKVIATRLFTGNVKNRAARVALEHSDKWANEQGILKIGVLIDLLQQEGLIYDANQEGSGTGNTGQSVEVEEEV